MTQYYLVKSNGGRWLTANYNWTDNRAMAARYSLCGAAHVDAARFGGVVEFAQADSTTLQQQQ